MHFFWYHWINSFHPELKTECCSIDLQNMTLCLLSKLIDACIHIHGIIGLHLCMRHWFNSVMQSYAIAFRGWVNSWCLRLVMLIVINIGHFGIALFESIVIVSVWQPVNLRLQFIGNWASLVIINVSIHTGYISWSVLVNWEAPYGWATFRSTSVKGNWKLCSEKVIRGSAATPSLRMRVTPSPWQSLHTSEDE